MPDSVGITLTLGGLGATILGLFLILGTAGIPEAYDHPFPLPARLGAVFTAVGVGALVISGVAW